MFVDEIVIKVIAGAGGDGCTSFRREKFVPMGGPDGGNGGKGASIIFKVDNNLKTLIDFSYKKIIKGEKGINGKGSNKYGANAEDIYLLVPAGTTIIDNESNTVLADMTQDKEEFVVALGGRGGRGNKAFATHDNPAPKFSEKGEPGEEKTIKLELKVLADVGLIGMPSVGKSTLLSQISASKPKIAAYHFTTLSPNLGVVRLKDYRSFVMADLPGLIEGASEGVGLGTNFLKHAKRTKILAHVIDMAATEGRNPIEDYKIIRKEIEEYDEKLANKMEVIVANKMDVETSNENLKKFKEKYPDKLIFPISSMNNTGIEALLTTLMDLLEEIPDENLYNLDVEEKTYTYENDKPFKIHKEDDIWIVEGEKIEKLFKMTRFEEEEGVLRFARKLKGMGVDDELERLGAKPGDEIQIMDYIFEFKG